MSSKNIKKDKNNTNGRSNIQDKDKGVYLFNPSDSLFKNQGEKPKNLVDQSKEIMEDNKMSF